MNLEGIRKKLQECENQILYAIFLRNNYKRNRKSYKTLNIGSDGFNNSIIRDIELAYNKHGFYNMLDSLPFTEDIIKMSTTNNKYIINHNNNICNYYFNKLLDLITIEGEDDFSSFKLAIEADILLLNALSRRIHLGKYVAECKFNMDIQWYNQIHSNEEIYSKLTNTLVENEIIERLYTKIGYLLKLSENNTPINIDNNIITIYRDFIIPETKQVQINYFKYKIL